MIMLRNKTRSGLQNRFKAFTQIIRKPEILKCKKKTPNISRVNVQCKKISLHERFSVTKLIQDILALFCTT